MRQEVWGNGLGPLLLRVRELTYADLFIRVFNRHHVRALLGGGVDAVCVPCHCPPRSLVPPGLKTDERTAGTVWSALPLPWAEFRSPSVPESYGLSPMSNTQASRP